MNRKLPIRIIQETQVIANERTTRKIFYMPPVKSQATFGPESPSDSDPSVPWQSQWQHPAEPGVYKISQTTHMGNFSNLWLLKRKSCNRKGHQYLQSIAVRVGSGHSGYAEWMKELQVYLLPNFRHPNILPLFMVDAEPALGDDTPTITSDDDGEAPQVNAAKVRNRIQYWLLNNFDDCILLRDFLKFNSIDWPQLIQMSLGIAQGLHFLHENSTYSGALNQKRLLKGFLESNEGAIQSYVFADNVPSIYMRPTVELSVIHQYLTSVNIVLKGPNLTPCIWNFSYSYIKHPFQPMNHEQYFEKATKEMFLKSPYSAPEILEEITYLSLPALKAVDLYALSMIYWEMLHRCRLPYIYNVDTTVNQVRQLPADYCEPWERELGPSPDKATLKRLICKTRARPHIRDTAYFGKKTFRYVQLIKDLWEHDFEARPRTPTIVDRLTKLSVDLQDYDYFRSFKIPMDINSLTSLSGQYSQMDLGYQTPATPKHAKSNIQVDQSYFSETPEPRRQSLLDSTASHDSAYDMQVKKILPQLNSKFFTEREQGKQKQTPDKVELSSTMT